MRSISLLLCLFASGARVLAYDEDAAATEGDSTHFSYEVEAPDGPTHWGGHCLDTGRQSPIDIPFEGILYDASIRGLTFKNYNTNSSSLHLILENDGHSAKVTVEGNPPLSIVSGGLSVEYFLTQFHFHWGENDMHGSEHKFDHREFPLEAHIVHVTKDPSIPEDQRIVVVAVMFELSDSPNPRLENIVRNLQNIKTPGTHVDLPSFTISDILPMRRDRYFRYSGSLTTPPCSDVVWIVFYDRILIDPSQDIEFRKLIEEHGHALNHNYRPVQQIGDRVIVASFMPFIVGAPYSASVSLLPVHASVSLIVMTIAHVILN